MKLIAAIVICAVCFAATALAQADSPEIRLSEGRLSADARNVSLAELLRTFDRVTGMASKVSPEVASRIVSVHFSDIPIDQAVRKIFEAQGMDYVFVWGRGVAAISLSQTPPVQTTSVPTRQGEIAPDSYCAGISTRANPIADRNSGRSTAAYGADSLWGDAKSDCGGASKVDE